MSSKASRIHRMSAGHFASVMMSRFAPKWLYAIGSLALLSAVVGFFVDLRVSAVGFFVILILIPQALAFTYYSHALCRECFVNTTPHTIEIRHNMIVTCLYVREDCSEDMDYVSDISPRPPEQSEYRYLRDEIFAPENITGWSIRGNAGIAELKDMHRGFLWIPVRAFETEEDFKRIADFMRIATSHSTK